MTVAVDLFAGWGGFTEGAESVGVKVAWAANHWQLAVDAHRRNHPEAAHVCQDLRQADWTALPAYDLMLASPACQGHSSASQPKRRVFHDAMRATAWSVIDCAEITNPKAIIVENVVNFMTEWQLFPVWREALVRLGYNVQEHVVNATDFGVPQRRKRVIIVASKRPIDLAMPGSPATEPGFAACLEHRDSIPERAWRLEKNAPTNVRARIAKGRARCGSTFLSQHVTGHPGVPLHEPIRTITTKDQWVLVDGHRYRSLTIRELARGQSFRDSYGWPDGATRGECITGLGNAVPPKMVAPLIQQVAASL